MKSQENNPVNEWNSGPAPLDFLNGGPLDSLLAQLARAGGRLPAIVAEMPAISSDHDALDTANAAPSGNSNPTSNQ